MSPSARPSRGSGGRLVLVGTPIGNLGDLPPRAVEALTAADVIACEDTRRTGRLLQLAGVTPARLLAVHEHNEASAAVEIIERLDEGATIVLVTDAGMPAISDPGERVVAAVAAAGHVVEVVPGPSAVVAALAVSGLPSGRFCFEGFLPRKGADRRARLAALSGEERTIVLYEAPHRLARTVAELAGALGEDRRVVIARELTKMHEEVWRGTLAEAGQRVATVEPRGEHVLVVDGAPPAAGPRSTDVDALLAELLAAGTSTRDAAAEAADQLGVGRREAYQRALALSAGEGSPGRGDGAAGEDEG